MKDTIIGYIQGALLLGGFLSMLVAYIAHSIHDSRQNLGRAIFNLFGPLFNVHALSDQKSPKWMAILFLSGALAIATCFVIVHLRYK